MRRGERLIPLLLARKGDKRFFYGYGLGPDNSWNHPVPQVDSDPNSGEYTTMEVTAIYLICAIYYETLNFADTSYLSDGTWTDGHKFNTPKRVGDAWISIEQWVRTLNNEGLQELQAKKAFPLQHANVRFWGTIR